LSQALLVTETGDLSADLLVLRLRECGIPFARFNQDQFPDGVEITWDIDRGNGEICFLGRRIEFADITAAWFRRPAAPTITGTTAPAFVEREAVGFLESLWEATSWLWINRPSAVRYAEHKPLQLIAARQAGLMVPATLITNSPRRAREFVRPRSAIAKAVVGGRVTEEGTDYAVFTNALTIDDLSSETAVRSSPTTFQQRVPVGADLRVTIVGRRLFAVKIFVADRQPHEVDWRAAEPKRLSYERCDLPGEIAASCLELMRGLSLNFGALDFIVGPEGEHVFLEINPSGQWGWIERQVDVPITDAIIDLLTQRADPCG
jgi:glutathione synthase/RimK-type ligase-like ATP-grasp enzyme